MIVRSSVISHREPNEGDDDNEEVVDEAVHSISQFPFENVDLKIFKNTKKYLKGKKWQD